MCTCTKTNQNRLATVTERRRQMERTKSAYAQNLIGVFESSECWLGESNEQCGE